MPTQQETKTFVAAFARHWQNREGGFSSIMHPGATLRVAGARVPYTYEQAERFVRSVKEAIPDISLQVLDWAARGDSVFTEWEMSGTIAGTRVRWQGINRNTLDGSRSCGAVSCWDRHSLLEQLEPERPPLDLAAELARLQARR